MKLPTLNPQGTTGSYFLLLLKHGIMTSDSDLSNYLYTRPQEAADLGTTRNNWGSCFLLLLEHGIMASDSDLSCIALHAHVAWLQGQEASRISWQP